MKIEKTKFQIYSKITKSADSQDDALILEGIASTTSVDIEGDYMTPACIESMKKQALGCNIHADHLYGLSDVVGTVIEVPETDENTLKIIFKILPSFKEKILEFLDNDVNLGLSVGGSVTDYTEMEDGWKIDNLELYEISLTPLPANMDTFGTVAVADDGVVKAKCLNGACKTIVSDIMAQNEKTEIKELIKAMTLEIKDELEELKDEVNKEAPVEGAEPVTKEEVVNMINEALVNIKDSIVSEVLEEVKNETKSAEPPVDEKEEEIEELEEIIDEEEKEELAKSLKEQLLTEVLGELKKNRNPEPTKVDTPSAEPVKRNNGATVMSRKDAARKLAGY